MLHRFSQGIQGIALTGWQRYDHFATLCELLPAALPSLAVCLAAASKGYFDVNSRNNPILSSLTCPESSERHPWLELQKDPTLSSFTRCMFPGSPVFRFIQRLSSTSVEAKEFIDNVKLKRGWLSDYNIRHNFSSATRVDELLEEEPRLMTSVTNLAKNAVDAMFDVYDHVSNPSSR
jgi:hexosaminidase